MSELRCRLALLEVASFGTLAAFYLWWGSAWLATNEARLVALAFFVVLGAYLLYVSPAHIFRDSLSNRGLGSLRTGFLRTDNFRAAAPRFAMVLVPGALLIIGASWWFNPGFVERWSLRLFAVKYGLSLLSATVQELILSGWLLLRIKAIIPVRWARHPLISHRLLVTLTIAVLAGLFHAPNGPLMVLGPLGIAGLVWVGYSHPNLLLCVITHATLNTLLHRVAELNMRVGLSYFDLELSPYRMLIPSMSELVRQLP